MNRSKRLYAEHHARWDSAPPRRFRRRGGRCRRDLSGGLAATRRRTGARDPPLAVRRGSWLVTRRRWLAAIAAVAVLVPGVADATGVFTSPRTVARALPRSDLIFRSGATCTVVRRTSRITARWRKGFPETRSLTSLRSSERTSSTCRCGAAGTGPADTSSSPRWTPPGASTAAVGRPTATDAMGLLPRRGGGQGADNQRSWRQAGSRAPAPASVSRSWHYEAEHEAPRALTQPETMRSLAGDVAGAQVDAAPR